MKDDLHERLKRLNKGRLADQLVSGRELAERGGAAAGGPSHGEADTKRRAKPAPARGSRKRLREDMVRPADGREQTAPDTPRPGSTGGLGALSGLRRRLREWESTGGVPGGTAQPSGTHTAGPSSIESAWEELRDAVEGEIRQTEAGYCIRREVVLPGGTWYGPQQTPEPHEIDPGIIAKVSRDERFATVAPEGLLFLDTETTGLAGGTGTFAFMAGVGFWREDGFHVVQYFMPDYPEEPALLSSLEVHLECAASLVTFNGKSFDVPLLASRFIRNRSGTARRLGTLPHLDLVHPSRRLWKRRVGDCSLTNLEREILAFEREEDIPGWEIPQVYFRFVTDGEVGPLPTVFLHNQFDLVTLAQLASRVCRLYREPLGEKGLPGMDLFSLARSLEMDGSPHVAVEVLEEARLADLDPELRRNVLRRLSRAYKRQRNWEGAVAIWQELGEWEGTFEVFSFEEMAKFYEHEARDLRLAETVTRRILEALSGDGVLDPVPYSDLDEVEAAFRHRLERIERKLARREGKRTRET